MSQIQCTCGCSLRMHQFLFGEEDWETEPTFYMKDSDEPINYCPDCGALLCAGNYSQSKEVTA